VHVRADAHEGARLGRRAGDQARDVERSHLAAADGLEQRQRIAAEERRQSSPMFFIGISSCVL
jgi:hypothetical protein